MTVGEVVERLAELYSRGIKQGMTIRFLPSVMLWGPPGVGKSQGVRQIARFVERETGKSVFVTDVRLLLFNPIDLRGIPTANADKTLAVWLKPQIFQMDPGEDAVNILFLDEISAAPQSVQASAYQITLDRTVGEHKLPDNCIVMAAGNRVTDKSVAYKMPKALANRLMHLEVEGNFSSWETWAVSGGIHEKVLGFLRFRPDYLMRFDAPSEDLAFATPRSWEMVSNLLKASGGEEDRLFPMIAGLVGNGMAVEMRTWCRVFQELPSMEDIFDGKEPSLPKNASGLYALTASMTSYAREHLQEMDRIGNSIRFAEKLPPDYSAVLMRDYIHLTPDYRRVLMKIPEFSRWMDKRGSLMNGIV